MLIVKKLFFALPFVLFLTGYCYLLDNFLKDPNLIISFSFTPLIQLAQLVLALLLGGFFFVIFVTISQNWKFILPVIIIAAPSSLLFIPTPISLILAAGFFLVFSLSALILTRSLTSYITFDASKLLSPTIKQIIFFITIVSSIAFYMSSSAQISANGFKIPDSLIDTAMQFIPKTDELNNLQGTDQSQQQTSNVTFSPEQIQLLKENKDLLKQYGIDPTVLETLNKPQTNQQTPARVDNQSLIKPIIQSQMEQIIKPYLGFIPYVFAFLFFSAVEGVAWIILIPLPLLVTFAFYLLEKSGYTKFETEMREVKKLVV